MICEEAVSLQSYFNNINPSILAMDLQPIQQLMSETSINKELLRDWYTAF